MELPCKLLEQLVFKTRPKFDKHMSVVMDKSTGEEKLPQAQQTKEKHYKFAVTFVTDFNGIFNVTSKAISSFLQHQLLIKMVSSE